MRNEWQSRIYKSPVLIQIEQEKPVIKVKENLPSRTVLKQKR